MAQRLIDANNLIQKLRGNVLVDVTTELEKEIENAPTIDPVKHGHWEEMRNAYGKLEGWIHAECGREVKCMEGYCPNCGARMDGE